MNSMRDTRLPLAEACDAVDRFQFSYGGNVMLGLQACQDKHEWLWMDAGHVQEVQE